MTGGVSDGLEILAGVPQGFIHSILAFIMFIDDMIKEINSNMLLFADEHSAVQINVILCRLQLSGDLKNVTVSSA